MDLFLGEDSQMDISHMLDTNLREPSPSHSFPGWPAAADLPPAPPPDTSSPGNNYTPNSNVYIRA